MSKAVIGNQKASNVVKVYIKSPNQVLLIEAAICFELMLELKRRIGFTRLSDQKTNARLLRTLLKQKKTIAGLL